ncbi:MAG: HEPN domain-containing protein [Sedimentisphaerales bacterium]|nr:HEPN domain-containing protein [Sedimentisphaerales bacterium]
MKPPEDTRRRLVAEWLRKADTDMQVAEHLAGEDAAFPSVIAFHCQQAGEKYLKALLTHWGIAFPKTHVLAKLLELVEVRGASVAESLLDAVVLTPYGAELRYPGDRPEASPDEAREAVRLARLVRDTVLVHLQDAADGR